MTWPNGYIPAYDTGPPPPFPADVMLNQIIAAAQAAHLGNQAHPAFAAEQSPQLCLANHPDPHKNTNPVPPPPNRPHTHGPHISILECDHAYTMAVKPWFLRIQPPNPPLSNAEWDTCAEELNHGNV